MIWALVVGGLILVVAAVLRAAAASLARTARADALREAAEGLGSAAAVAELLDDRPSLQPAIGLVHSGLLVSAVLLGAAGVGARVTGGAKALWFVGVGIGAVLLGDLAPRWLGRRYPGTVAYRFSWFLSRTVALGVRANDLLPEDDAEVEEEEQDDYDREERELITQVIEFSDAIVREVMVPRTDMVTIGEDLSTDDALDVVVERGYSRIPVAGEHSDDILGTIYAKDLLRLMDDGSGPIAVTQLMRDVYFVPETKRVPDLLRDMQASKVHQAIVVDEFGGTAGLVTIEDLIEELVGEIIDEYDTEKQLVVESPSGDLVVDGRLSVEELGDMLGVELPDDDWDTVGGLVLGLAGRVPREGEAFDVEGVTLTCVKVQGRRVAVVSVHRPAPAKTGS